MRAVGSQTTETTTTTTQMISRKLAPADRTLIFRLVGFYEYIKALEHFDRLIQMCDQDELKVIDDIIREKDEFAVYVNLSRRLQRGNSNLSETAADGEDNFERRGFAWVTALARVEVGAMFAGFTSVMSPFEWVRPSQMESAAYRELLEDGMRTHYWALVNDPEFQQIATGRPDHKTVAYVRRLTVARAFLEAAAKIGGAQLAPEQIAELHKWKSDLDKVQYGMIANIESYLGSFSRSNSKTSSNTKDIDAVYACGKMLKGEKYELAQGTASITTESVGGDK